MIEFTGSTLQEEEADRLRQKALEELDLRRARNAAAKEDEKNKRLQERRKKEEEARRREQAAISIQVVFHHSLLAVEQSGLV